MKIYQIIATSAMAALVLAGCNKETETPETPDPDAGLKEVTISINGAKMTKGQATPVVEWGTAAAEISKYDIYFTTASGIVKYHYQIASTGEYTNAYNEFKEGRSVRFIGLENISQVYVVANATIAVITTGQNISTLENLAIENYGGDKTKNDILYVGGDKDLTPIESEPAPGVDINVPSDEEMASQYYTADIYLRPVISRIEIGDVYVRTAGELTETVQTEDGEKTIKYTWTGFTPKLTGIYMSNVAGSLNPMTATVGEWFAKPTGTQIAEGKWSDNITYVDGETFNMAASEMNVKKVLWYSNYTSEYGDLFADNYAETDGDNHYYFNGMKETAGTKTCIPFNFFVPFDVTDENNTTEAAAVWNGANENAAENNPALHFQFDFSDKGTAGSAYAYQVYDMSSGSEKKITAESDPDLYAQLTSRLNFNTVSDNIYYANVTSFKEGDAPVNVAPNTIYKLTGVGITPFNLATGTEAVDEEYNIIVKVTTVDYIEKNVTPSFDNE